MYVGKIHFNDDVVLNVCESLKNFEFKFKTMFSCYLFAVVVWCDGNDMWNLDS